ncbi:hypothetical protein MTBBW1_1410025 [Desulfamplus magnetovallimortis]|uniref:Uncharacterized protein n=1 Tax=Desulfamplus magnetovallimortis TaxID=1246637 RepID=A0A1W1H8A1_9BACT|nr:hypothetical protein MTBBW1_1410025 [Desulfamplus magnetovallimortis]
MMRMPPSPLSMTGEGENSLKKGTLNNFYMKVSVTACFLNDFHLFDCGGHQPCTL